MSLLLQVIGEDLVTFEERAKLTIYQAEVLAAVRKFGSFQQAAKQLGRHEKAIQMTMLRVNRRL